MSTDVVQFDVNITKNTNTSVIVFQTKLISLDITELKETDLDITTLASHEIIV